MLLFEQAIKSEATKVAYKYHLEKFRVWSKIKNYDGLLQAPHKQIQELIEDYVMHLKKNISPNSVPIYFAPIELFYVMNDIDVNFKKIRKLFPDKVKKGNERGYTREEIRKILGNTKTARHRALVLLFSSSGCRLGAIPGIKLTHLSKIEDSYSIMIYEGDKEEDFIFITPEATNAIDAYLDERKKDGEYLNAESPLFRTTYRLGIEKPKACSVDNLTHIMARLVDVINRKRTGKTKRFDIAKNHGFRKFFATIIKDIDGISPTMTEKLINHIGIVQLDGAYFKPTKQKMFDAYKKTIPELTIDDSERLRFKNKKLVKEKSEVKKLEKRIEELEYGKKPREAEFFKQSFEVRDEPGKSVLQTIFYLWFEMRASEDEKREIWKKILEANKKGEKINFAKLFDKPGNLSIKNYYSASTS